MKTAQRSGRYGAAMIGLHWLSALLVIGAIALIESHEWFPRGDPMRTLFVHWHFHLGVLVLVLSVLRLASRLGGSRPESLSPAGSLARRAEGLVHGLFYVLLLALPLSGLAFLYMGGRPVTLFGWELPLMAAGGKEVAKPAKEIHELMGNAMIFLILLHVAAAVWHQRVLRDGLLQRMLPGTR